MQQRHQVAVDAQCEAYGEEHQPDESQRQKVVVVMCHGFEVVLRLV